MTAREAQLRRILIDRRRESEDDGRRRQTDVEPALLQMRAETRTRIDAALGRLDCGAYGSCAECEREIAARRLRALPFAMRCQDCEDDRETRARERNDARQLARNGSELPLFSGLAQS